MLLKPSCERELTFGGSSVATDSLRRRRHEGAQHLVQPVRCHDCVCVKRAQSLSTHVAAT